MKQKISKSSTDSFLPKPTPKILDILQINSVLTKDIPIITDARNDPSKLSAIRASTKMTNIEKLPAKRLSNLLRINIDKTKRKSCNVENQNNSVESAPSVSPNHIIIKRESINKGFSSVLSSEIEGIKSSEIPKFTLSKVFVKDLQKSSNSLFFIVRKHFLQ